MRRSVDEQCGRARAVDRAMQRRRAGVLFAMELDSERTNDSASAIAFSSSDWSTLIAASRWPFGEIAALSVVALDVPA